LIGALTGFGLSAVINNLLVLTGSSALGIGGSYFGGYRMGMSEKECSAKPIFNIKDNVFIN
jgi:hypothetical protein